MPALTKKTATARVLVARTPLLFLNSGGLRNGFRGRQGGRLRVLVMEEAAKSEWDGGVHDQSSPQKEGGRE